MLNYRYSGLDNAYSTLNHDCDVLNNGNTALVEDDLMKNCRDTCSTKQSFF